MPKSPRGPVKPLYLRFEKALTQFVDGGLKTQSAKHIKPLHRYIAMRLVIEGGFAPDEITPHPPLAMTTRGRERFLHFDAGVEDGAEATVIGGLKSKKIDVVVCKAGVGPVLAISVKGTIKAFRNLTNRMEEAIGDSTNLHIMYPGLVYGFFHIIQANHAGTPGVGLPDVSIGADRKAVKAVQRYHDVLAALAGRRLVRDDYTKYEAVGFTMVETGPKAGEVFPGFPDPSSPLAPEKFFSTLFDIYDLRFPYMSHRAGLTRRWWSSESPVFDGMAEGHLSREFGYAPRIGIPEMDEDAPEESGETQEGDS